MKTINQTQVEQLKRSDKPSFESPEVAIDAGDLHETLDTVADSFDVAGFKCVKCGLAHMHDTTKHRLSDTFDVSESDAAMQMDYNSVCHCGVQEASRRGSDAGIDEQEAASIAEEAPIPPEISRKMDRS